MQDLGIKDELVEEITNAFSFMIFPKKGNLVNLSYGQEGGLVEHHFYGHEDWKSLAPVFLDFEDALSFFSDEAFRFFLPAFMIADLHGVLENNDPTIRLCWSVTEQSENIKISKVWGGQTIGKLAKECFDIFTEVQVNAIISYLQWRLLHGDINYIIDPALKNYWLPRLENFTKG